MSRRPLLGAFALLVAAAGLTAALAPQEKSKDKPKPAAAGMDDMSAMMAPGPEHKVLDARVGKWNCAVKFWMPGTDQAMESTSTCEVKWILGNRYLTEESKGSMMGMPFEGLGITGYDRMKKQYFNSWYDNFSTGKMESTGTYDAATKTLTLTGKTPDPMSGKDVEMKLIHRDVDANSSVFEMHSADPESGKMTKMMEITYTKAK